ncbi:MAG: hypothetical protein AB7E42_00090 [Anaerotignaceae bacterium]
MKRTVNKVFKEISNEEIMDKFNIGVSRDALINYVSGTTGLKKIDAKKMVERAIYEDYMRSNKSN